VPYVTLLFILNRVATGKMRIPDIVATGLGSLAGGVVMACIFLWKHALLAYLSQTVASGYNIIGAGIQAAEFRDAASVQRFISVLRALSPVRVIETVGQNFGSSLLILYLAVVLVCLWRSRASTVRAAAALGAVAALLVPYGMLAAGRYAYYYTWMGTVPVAVIFTVAIERCSSARMPRLLTLGLVTGVAAIIVGMPLQIWQEVRKTPSSEYAAVEDSFRRETKPGDIVYADPVFYYSAKEARVPFFSMTYAGGRGYRRMAEEERARVSLAMVPANEVAATVDKLGGVWVRESEIRSPSGSDPIIVLRRPPVR
jgi:hypothetical protein